MQKYENWVKKYDLNIPKGWYGFSNIPPGWDSIVEILIENLIHNGWNKELHQCKSKFGGLRFYIGESNPKLEEIIEAAEKLSYSCCEECGSANAGPFTLNFWIHTLCPNHQKELESRHKSEVF